jgi:phage tail sheath protein FI
MDGGFATPAYGQALDTIAKTRMDSVAILSTPFTAETASDYIGAISDYRKNELNLNSSYAALYTPHVLIQDQFNDREIFVSPDGFVGGTISFTANTREIWFPPAGFRRGVLDVLDVNIQLESGERSILYGIGVNPIKKAPGRGIVIWGQKTLLSRPSLLESLNVRLLLIVISPAMKEFLEDYLFEINDRITRSEVEQKISDYLVDIQSRRGLERFQVICDETNNTPQVIDQKRMIVDVLITPTNSVEDIPLRIVIVSNSTSFADAAQAV